MRPARKFRPLIPGTVLRYRGKEPPETSESTFEILELQRYPTHTSAICRNRWSSGTEQGESRQIVQRSARGIYAAGEIELPPELEVGLAWTQGNRDYHVDSFDSVVDTPAGRFRQCLEVTYLVAGGDGGYGKRCYAPWIGMLREDNAEEGESWTRELIGFHVPHEIFVAHATEDKERLARPLAQSLARQGFRVWYDEFNLQLGDRFEPVLTEAIRNSITGVAILSGAFLSKRWTRFELALLADKLRFVVLSGVRAAQCVEAVARLDAIAHAPGDLGTRALVTRLLASLPEEMTQ